MSAYTNALQGLLKVGSMLNRPSNERVASSAHELRLKIARDLRANAQKSDQERSEDFLSFVKFPVHNIIVCLLAGIDIYNDLSSRDFDLIKTLSDAKLAKLLLKRTVKAPDDKDILAADFLFVGTDFVEKDASDKEKILRRFFDKTRLAVSNLSYIYAVLQTNNLKTVNGMPVEEVVPQILLSLITGVDTQEDDDYDNFEIVRGQFRKKRKKNLFTRYLTKAKGLYNKSLRVQATKKLPYARRATELLLNFSFLPHRLTDMVKTLVGEFGAARGGVDTSVLDYENVLTEDMTIASFEINELTETEASRTDEMKALYTRHIANVNFEELSDEEKKKYVETAFNLINYRDLSDRALATLRENLHLIEVPSEIKKKMLGLVLDKQFIKGTLSPVDESMIGLDAYDEREIESERKSIVATINERTKQGAYFDFRAGLKYTLCDFKKAISPSYDAWVRSGGSGPVPSVLTSKQAKAHASLYFRNKDKIPQEVIEEVESLYNFIVNVGKSDHPLAWRPRSSYKRKNRDLKIGGADLATYALRVKAKEDPRISRVLTQISGAVSAINTLEDRKNKVRELVTAVLDTSEYISQTLKSFALGKAVSATDRARSQSYVPSHKVAERRAKRYLAKDKTQLLDRIKEVFFNQTKSSNADDTEVEIESSALKFKDFISLLTEDYFGDFSELSHLIEKPINEVLNDPSLSATEQARKIRDLYSDVVAEKRGESDEAKNYDANFKRFSVQVSKFVSPIPPPQEGAEYTREQRQVAFLNSFLSALIGGQFSRAERLIPLLPKFESESIDYKALVDGAVGKALNNFEVVLRRKQRAELEIFSEKLEEDRNAELEKLNAKIKEEQDEAVKEQLSYDYAVIESRSEDDKFSKELRAFKRSQRVEMQVAFQEAEERGETKILATYNKYVDRASDKIEETIVEVLSNLALAEQKSNEDDKVIRSLNKTLVLKSKIGDGAFESIIKDSGISTNMNLNTISRLKEMVHLYKDDLTSFSNSLLIAFNLARSAYTGLINAVDNNTETCYKSASPFEDVFAFDGIIRFFQGIKDERISDYTGFPGISWEKTDVYFFGDDEDEDALLEKFFNRDTPLNRRYYEIRNAWLEFMSELSYYLAIGSLYTETNVPSDIRKNLSLGQQLLAVLDVGGETRLLKSAIKELMSRTAQFRGKTYVAALQEKFSILTGDVDMGEDIDPRDQISYESSLQVRNQGMESTVVQNAIRGVDENGNKDPKFLRLEQEVVESIFRGEYENITKIPAESVFLEITGKIREINEKLNPPQDEIHKIIYGLTDPADKYSEEYSAQLDAQSDDMGKGEGFPTTREVTQKLVRDIDSTLLSEERPKIRFTREFDRLFTDYLDRNKERLCEEMGAPKAPSRRLLEYFLHHGRIGAYHLQDQTDFTTMDDNRFYLLSSLGGLDDPDQ